VVAAFQPVGRDDVNGPAEQRLKFPRHAYQVEKGAALIEVNEQVNVAVGPVVTARRGAEKANSAGVMASHGIPGPDGQRARGHQRSAGIDSRPLRRTPQAAMGGDHARHLK
jgi:hypothetical protein